MVRPLWAGVYELVIRGVAALLLRGESGGVFVGGTFGHGQPVYGVSDVDLIVVTSGGEGAVAGARRRKIKERWRRLCGRVPLLRLMVTQVYVYEEEELHRATETTYLTYGLAADSVAHPRSPHAELVDEGSLLQRPGLWATQEWRLVGGRDVRPVAVTRDRQHERLAAWLELQFWWRFAYGACAEPLADHVPYLCVKLVAEPTRIWLWLTRREQIFERRAVLRRGLELLPGEEYAFRTALALHDDLPRAPAAPLAEVLPFFLRLSEQLARLFVSEMAGAGTTAVHLVGSDDRLPRLSASVAPLLPLVPERALEPLPLADWRAIVNPRGVEEVFAVLPGNAADPKLLGAAARAAQTTVYPALREGELLLFPTNRPGATILRSIHFSGSDPVSFALVAGAGEAAFPRVAGWAARDVALRAVAEHRAWLESGRIDRRAPETLVALFTAARAALLLESHEAHRPELPLTVAATAERLAARNPADADSVLAALVGCHAAFSGLGRPSERTTAALERVVRGLPPYASRLLAST